MSMDQATLQRESVAAPTIRPAKSQVKVTGVRPRRFPSLLPSSKPPRPRSKGRELTARIVHILSDLVLLNLAFHFTVVLRFGTVLSRAHGPAPWAIYSDLEVFMNLMWGIMAIATRLYTAKRQRYSIDEIRTVFRATLYLAGSFLLFIVARGGYNFYSRLFLGYFFVAAPLLMVLFRVVVHSTAATVRNQTVTKKNVLIIGAGRSGERFYHTVSENPEYGYRVLGFLDDNGVQSKVRSMILGKILDLDAVASQNAIDEVVIALPKASEETIAQLVTDCENRCIRVAVIPNDYAALEGKRAIEQVGEFSIVRMQEAPLDRRVNQMKKRAFDIIFSVLILTLIFPFVFAFSALLIKLTSRGSILFKQLRTGEDGKSFVCYKFRTMRSHDRKVADSLQAVKNDPRLTWIGKLLRRTSMDELPQFWNVLKGDMSAVGPRPHMLKHTEDYRNIISRYMVRHLVKPGVTGWAQVNGYRGATMTPEHMQRRIEHDLYYIENWSFLLDLVIIGRTVVSVIRGDKNAY